MRFLNALENARLALKISLLGLGLSFILNLFLGYGLIVVPRTMKTYFPPQIPSSGLLVEANHIPPETLYSFAVYVWQTLNYWPHSGVKDYLNNLQTYSAYLTPRFSAYLKEDYNQRLNVGELQDRLSNLQLQDDSQPISSYVKAIGQNTWIVYLHMKLTERMAMNDQKVKETNVAYRLRVVRYNVNAKENPWGLALDGFAQSPLRISDNENNSKKEDQ